MTGIWMMQVTMARNRSNRYPVAGPGRDAAARDGGHRPVSLRASPGTVAGGRTEFPEARTDKDFGNGNDRKHDRKVELDHVCARTPIAGAAACAARPRAGKCAAWSAVGSSARPLVLSRLSHDALEVEVRVA